MPARKPLVLVGGQLQQLSPLDTLDAVVTEVDTFNLNNGGSTPASFGTPVCISTSNAFQPARANASATVEVLGFVRSASIAVGMNGGVQTDGFITGTTAQWDAITGQSGGLITGSVYFLSATSAGQITATAPTATGEYLVRLGRSVGPETLEISIQPPILL